MEKNDRLYSYEFTVLCLASTFAFCNIAIFYSLSGYLERLGIDPAWRGLIIAAEPAMAVILRPLISPLLTPANALAVLRVALTGNGAALVCYRFAGTVPWLLAVRMVHGASFVCLVSAVTALLVGFIPKGRSAQAFGVFSLTSLAPFAVMPLATELLLRFVGDESAVYALASLLIVPALVLLAPLGRRIRRAGLASQGAQRPSRGVVLDNLRRPKVLAILAANLCVFLCSTMVFFYAKGYAVALGAADPGLFFSIVFGAMIAVRLLGNAVFDKLPRVPGLIFFLVSWCVCLALMARAVSPGALFVLAAGYGLCLGVIQPLLNAAMYQHSPPDLRGININMMLFMMDAGYFLGPLAGGTLLAFGFGFPALFFTGAGWALLAALLLSPLARARMEEEIH
jgi:MFS family permease